MLQHSVNNRILIIDDEEVIRDSVRAILMPAQRQSAHLDQAAFDLFGDTKPLVKPANQALPAFELDEAPNGRAGLEKVRQGLENDQPYSVILLDMRMPGWDGLETCKKIREVDPLVQIFFVTAFSDQPLEEIIKVAGSDVGYLCKPFASEEITQIAVKGIYDWNRLRNLEAVIDLITRLGHENTGTHPLLVNILHQVSDYLGASYTFLGTRTIEGKIHKIFEVGMGADRINLAQVSMEMGLQQGKGGIFWVEQIICCPLDQYVVIALIDNKASISKEHQYLFELFIQNASIAVANTKLQQKLVQKEKLSAIGQAISMVMHDIKNPIAQVSSIVDLIRDDPGNAQSNLELVDMIEEANQDAMDIINDFRDFTTNADIRKNRENLSLLFEEIRQSTNRRKPDSQVKMDFDVEAELILGCDLRKLNRVFTNLINNAMEAMEEHQVVAPQLLVRSFEENGHIITQVQDNGPGIPEKIQATLFEPFVTSGKVKGTGLGLAIVKQIVEAHQGSINVSSSSAGAAFTISIPQNV
ncbi:MAG: hybrid sensor histidine kinase/response regulator [Bacteroidota bacterium]